MNDADVIVLQETFDGPSLDSFVWYFNWLTSYEYHITDIEMAKNGTFSQDGHGIVILTKFPILDEEHFNYNVCNGGLFSCDGDCLASKGFVRVTLNIGNDDKAYVLGTHLDAGDCQDDVTSRFTQMSMIDNYINDGSFNKSYPFFIVGDLNINTRSGSFGLNSEAQELGLNFRNNYQYMKTQLNAWASWASTSTSISLNSQQSTPNGMLLDYIMIRNDFRQPSYHSTSNYNVDCTVADSNWTDHCNVSHHFSFVPTPSSSDISIENSCDGSIKLIANNYNGITHRYRYRIQGTSIWTTTSNTTSYSLSIGKKPECTSYQIQIQLKCGNIWLNWSPTKVLTTQPYSVNDAGIFGPTFTNSKAYLYADSHIGDIKQFRYRQVEGLWPNLWSFESTKLHYVLTNKLLENTAYEYQVRRKCGTSGEYSCWSQSKTFIIPLNSSGGKISPRDPNIYKSKKILESEIVIYPNPATGTYFQVKLDHPEKQIKTLRLIDFNGQIIWFEKYNGQTSANVDIEDLPAGIYMLSVNNEVAKRIVRP